MMVEQDEKRARRILDSLDIGAVNANGGSPAVLKDLLTEKTRLFLAVTEKDEFNIFACQVAKKLRPEVSTIARVRNPDYMVGDIQWESFGVDRTFSPERLTASKMKKLAMVEDHRYEGSPASVCPLRCSGSLRGTMLAVQTPEVHGDASREQHLVIIAGVVPPPSKIEPSGWGRDKFWDLGAIKEFNACWEGFMNPMTSW